MREDEGDPTGGEEVPWLREMMEEDLLGLFSDEPEEIARCVRQVVTRAAEDPSVLERLIDALRTSVESQNDDTQASNWIALILGRIGDTAALPVLFLGLGGEDESLQEASRDALLLIGPAAIEGLMDELEEDPGPELVDAGYRLLGCVGSLRDPALLDRTMDFLAERVDREAAKPRDECRIESLFQASALLGDRRMIEPMDRVLRERFAGKNAAIRDSKEMLLENASGDPLVHDSPAWIEEHRWLFQEDLESLRVNRARRQETEEGTEAPRPEEKCLSSFYWGMGTTVGQEEGEPLDARRFIADPSKEDAPEDAPEDASEEEEEGEEEPEGSEESGDSDDD